MDMQFFNSIMAACDGLLKGNIPAAHQPFINEFIQMHNPTANAQTQQNALQLYNTVITNYQRMQNGQGGINPDQMSQYVGPYVEAIYRKWAQYNAGGGMRAAAPMMYSGPSYVGGGAPVGFTNTAAPRPAGSHLSDDSGVSTQQRAAPTPTPAPNQQVTVPPVGAPVALSPVDTIVDNNPKFQYTDDTPNWGFSAPRDKSIVMMNKRTAHTQDGKLAISMYDGFNRAYYNDSLDVAKHFYQTVPNTLLAEPYIFRVFYNHVEELDISTESFLEVRKLFLANLLARRDQPVYQTVIAALNGLLHGPRMAVANYLVKQINRALFLAFRMSEFPEVYISFTMIEDLEELLGTGFRHRLVEQAGARSSIVTIVNHAILNAFAGMTDVMFRGFNLRDIETIKSSNVFPSEMTGVYPDKSIIPSENKEAAYDFWEAFSSKNLNHKTYMRQIRSVVFTNLFGQKVLPKLQSQPQRIETPVGELFHEYHQEYLARFDSNEDGLEYYDFGTGKETSAEEYKAYLENPDQYIKDETQSFIQRDLPKLPVDQLIFATQYKSDPYKYLMPIDLCTTMDQDNRTGDVYLAKHVIKSITPEQ